MEKIRRASGNIVGQTASRPPRHGAAAERTRRAPWLAATALLLTLSVGCTSWREYVCNGFKVGRNYRRPAAPVADEWIDSKDSALSGGGAVDAAWWRTFHDPVLDSLVNSAYQQNLTLRIAGLRILEARAQRAIAAGELFPQSQQNFGDYTRIALSKNGTSGAALDRHFGEWTSGFSMAWEIDFWGRFRRAVEAADAHLDASIENYDNVLVLLLADVARAYADVRTAEERLKYTHENVEIQRKSLKLAQERFDNGATTKLDVTQGESNLAQTEALIPPLEATRRQAINQLCILMGMPPHNLDEMLAAHAGIPQAPPQVAVGIPAELLRRRPDIRQVEREVAAQSALIGVAESELYPHFSITGNIYFDALKFEDLFDAKSLAGSVGPSFNWNILNYGRLANNILVQEARFQQLAVQYQNTVLQANAEAEDAIVQFLKSQQQVRSLAESARAAGESVDLVWSQYREGAVDFNRVFNVQQFLTQQQDQLAVAQGIVAKSLIQLYKALGGGWQIRLSSPAPPSIVAAAPVPGPGPVPAPSPEALPAAPVPAAPRNTPAAPAPVLEPAPIPAEPKAIPAPTPAPAESSKAAPTPTLAPLPAKSAESAPTPALIPEEPLAPPAPMPPMTQQP
jgi:NodT family efflux transporter outer membrane factor (OMF) lipoprotein